ncbi:MAG: ZIP family zinc transporter [Methanospirillum sp.]
MAIPPEVLAGFWGLLAGSALLVGAAAGYFARVPERVHASVMAFGAGVLISAISFELLDEAFRLGGAYTAAAGLLVGGAIFTVANIVLARRGAEHRKRHNPAALAKGKAGNNGPAIAVGSLIDGIPESIAIGLTIVAGGAVSTATVIAIFLSNIPEGLSSSAGMKTIGWSAPKVFGLWTAIAVVSGAASLAGYAVFSGLSAVTNAFVLALAAGGILAMLADTMVPEAFSEERSLSGMVTVVGFIVSFLLSMLG